MIFIIFLILPICLCMEIVINNEHNLPGKNVIHTEKSSLPQENLKKRKSIETSTQNKYAKKGKGLISMDHPTSELQLKTDEFQKPLVPHENMQNNTMNNQFDNQFWSEFYNLQPTDPSNDQNFDHLQIDDQVKNSVWHQILMNPQNANPLINSDQDQPQTSALLQQNSDRIQINEQVRSSDQHQTPLNPQTSNPMMSSDYTKASSEHHQNSDQIAGSSDHLETSQFQQNSDQPGTSNNLQDLNLPNPDQNIDMDPQMEVLKQNFEMLQVRMLIDPDIKQDDFNYYIKHLEMLMNTLSFDAKDELSIKLQNLIVFFNYYKALGRLCLKFAPDTIIYDSRNLQNDFSQLRIFIDALLREFDNYQQHATKVGFEAMKKEICQ